MNALQQWMEKHLVPVAAKIGSQKHLVLNSLFFIPLLLAPMVSVTIAYIATALHLVSPVVLQVPWVTPPFINAFMATGFDWRAIIVTAVTFAASFAIWFPFVIAANSMEEEA